MLTYADGGGCGIVAEGMTVESFLRGVRRFVAGFTLLQVAVIGVFVTVGPWWALRGGMPFALVLIAAIGLLFDWRALDVLLGWLPAPAQRAVVKLSAAAHLTALAIGGWLLAQPVDPAWTLLSGSASASDPRLVFGTDGALVMHTGAGQLLRRRETDWWDLLGPRAFAWEFHVGPDGALWTAPRGMVRIDRYDPQTDTWRAFGRPPGELGSLAVGTGELLAVVGGRLHRGDMVAGTWSEVQEVGPYVRSVALAPDSDLALACGRRWSVRERGVWADVTPAPELGAAEAFVGGGGWRYALIGGVWSGELWAAAPGQGFRRVTAPVPDTRVLAPHPVDGRRVLAASWGQGVWRSEDGGETWTPLGLERVEVRTLAVNWARGEVCAGASNLMFVRGVFCRAFPDGHPSALR